MQETDFSLHRQFLWAWRWQSANQALTTPIHRKISKDSKTVSRTSFETSVA